MLYKHEHPVNICSKNAILTFQTLKLFAGISEIEKNHFCIRKFLVIYCRHVDSFGPFIFHSCNNIDIIIYSQTAMAQTPLGP